MSQGLAPFTLRVILSKKKANGLAYGSAYSLLIEEFIFNPSLAEHYHAYGNLASLVFVTYDHYLTFQEIV